MARDARNLIITLIIIAIGIKLITLISNRYIASAGNGLTQDASYGLAGFSSLVAAFQGLGDLAFYGLIIIAVLLVPYYLSKRSHEKKM